MKMPRRFQEPQIPPPPGDVWERIEQARRELAREDPRANSLSGFSKMVGLGSATYGHIGGRNNWNAEHATTDKVVRFLSEKKGYDRTWLTTFKGLDAARSLYERNGFMLAGEADKDDQWGGGVREQIFERAKPKAPSR